MVNIQIMFRTHPAPMTALRDDTMMLLHAEPMRRALDERTEDLKTGAMMLAVFILGTAVGLMVMGAHDGPQTFFMGLFSLIIWLALIVAALSPIIMCMLMVEWRRLRQDRDRFEALLRRYNRI